MSNAHYFSGHTARHERRPDLHHDGYMLITESPPSISSKTNFRSRYMLFVVHFRHDSRQHQKRFPNPAMIREVDGCSESVIPVWGVVQPQMRNNLTEQHKQSGWGHCCPQRRLCTSSIQA